MNGSTIKNMKEGLSIENIMPKKPIRQIKRLSRSRKDRMLGGVCGGLAEYFEVDPTIVRLIWILLIFFSMGGAILAYLIAWVIIPERPVR